MLSAVELHGGPGGIGIYSHHPPFSRPSSSASSPAHHLHTTIAPQQQTSPMSGTEFARPKPKSIGSLNGLPTSSSSPTQKYSHHEQNGPVNLAVNHQPSRGSPPSKVEHLSDQKEIDVVGLGMSSSSPIGSPMSYATTSSRISYPNGLGTNAYQALNYSFYGNRYGTPMFPHRSAYPQHHPSRPTYLPPQLDSYPSYLSAYTSNTVGGYSTNVTSPQMPSSGELSHKNTSERSHSMSSLTNGHHPYAMKEKEPKSAGQRLPVEDARNNNNNNFKVPSGKEGSLKHRILTTSRPHGDKQHGTINHPANRSPLGNNSFLNFTRGSLIELSNGTLRRVEELRTEDFIMSAEKSPDLQLADSTVVKIMASSNNNCVMITFSYDNSRSKIDIEAKLEHPFFVYGQGWASCHPEGSMTSFGLKCQRLQVGDVCISLKPRELKLEPPLSPMAQKRTMHQHQQAQHQQHQREIQREIYHQQVNQQQQQDSMPQNLSRRSSTIPTTATDTSSSSQMALYSLQMSLFAAAAAGQSRIPSSYAPFMNDDSSAHLSHELNTSMNNNNNNSNDKLPLMMSKNSCSSAQEDYDEMQARKRRWSASSVDEDQQQLLQSRKIAN